MIHLTNVTLKRGSKTLFAELDLTVHAGHRVGIVGRNGVGKTSLFLLLRGRLLPEEGDVKLPRSWTIAHLAQETVPSPMSALEWTMDGDRPLREVQRRIAAAEEVGEHRRLAALYAELEAIDGYTAEARAGRILDGLGFAPEDASRRVADFSGGWRIRLNLAQTLMCRSDLLLLDEPTNHLDLDAVMWLEQWLVRRPGTTLLISHDRDFLDRAATDIVHLENGNARAYRGGYSSFERQRSERLVRERATYEKQQRRAQEIRAFVARFGAKNTKASQARSRMKELERLALIAPAHADSAYRFSFPGPERVSRPLLLLDGVSFGYGGGAPVIAGVRLTLEAGARIGLLGRNGAGKSTLMRGIAGDIAPLSGLCERGRNAPVGYFAQHTMETLEPAKNSAEHLSAADPKASDQDVRDFLGGWGFSGESAFTPTSHLSGGERARLALALIAWRKPAVLLLDEPTNHLDLDMRHSLTVALQSYGGALVIVSHDRHLLGSTVDELVLVADGRVAPYRGTLDDYREWLLGREDPLPAADGESARGAAAARRRAGAQERARLKPLRDELRTLEARLEDAQAKLDTVTGQLADTESYQRLSGEEVSDLIARHKRYRARVEGLEAAWMAVSEKLDAATAA